MGEAGLFSRCFFSGSLFSSRSFLSGSLFSSRSFLSGSFFSGRSFLSGSLFSSRSSFLSGSLFSGRSFLSGSLFSGRSFLSGSLLSSRCSFLSSRSSFSSRCLFSGRCLLSAALGIHNGLNDTCKCGNRSVECVADSGKKNFVSRKISQFVDLVETDDRTLKVTALQVEILMGLGELLQDAGCSRMVFLADGKCGRTDQNIFQLGQVGFVSRSAENGVLDDAVLNACFTQFTAKNSVVSNVDALVFNNNAGNRVVELGSEL